MSKLWRVIGDNATEQVLLETSAENVTVADTGEKLEATTVEGALSELADGVNEARRANSIDVGQGTPTTENGYTITPVNFIFSDGTSKTVNIYAEQGEKGDTVATGAKITGELSTTGWMITYPEWAESNLPAERKWNSVAYGNGVFVAVASPTQYGLYSEDGITWTEISLPESRGWVSVTYGGDKFVAVASNTQYGAYSTDGINWTTMTMPASRYWTDITYGNGKFVAIAENSSKYGAYSTDGINWTTMTMPAGRSWVSVAYGNNKFVAVTSATSYGAYSTDGITWKQMSLDATRDWTGITYGNGKFVAVATDSEYGAYSTDGIHWTYMQLPRTAYWHDITYGNGMFVAIAEYNSIAAYSTDGINWFTKTLMIGRWHGVIYGSGKFIAVANNSIYTTYWDVSKLSCNYTISDTAIKANSTVTMYLNSADEVQAYSKTDGSVVVEMDAAPTVAIPYTLQVIETSTEGTFEIVNSYVPTVPNTTVESVNGQTGAVTIAVPTKTSELENDSNFLTTADIPTKTSDLQNDSGFVKTSEANTFTGEQTFSNTNGIKTNRALNLNDNTWYEFGGTNNRFGSLAKPTIIRTSEARPKAEVPSGSFSVTKEIALLEDTEIKGQWSEYTYPNVTLTESGLYQIWVTSSSTATEHWEAFVYWDGTSLTRKQMFVYYSKGTDVEQPDVQRIYLNVANIKITNGGVLSIEEFNTTYSLEGALISSGLSNAGFIYRKIN